jgi:hypothetical protein
MMNPAAQSGPSSAGPNSNVNPNAGPNANSNANPNPNAGNAGNNNPKERFEQFAPSAFTANPNPNGPMSADGSANAGPNAAAGQYNPGFPQGVPNQGGYVLLSSSSSLILCVAFWLEQNDADTCVM